jgi:hypothetical protein
VDCAGCCRCRGRRGRYRSPPPGQRDSRPIWPRPPEYGLPAQGVPRSVVPFRAPLWHSTAPALRGFIVASAKPAKKTPASPGRQSIQKQRSAPSRCARFLQKRRR